MGRPRSSAVDDDEDYSEVEVLSPYVDGSGPSSMPIHFPASTLVRRPRAVKRRDGLRAIAIAFGAMLVTAMGIGLGVLGVVLMGLRDL